MVTIDAHTHIFPPAQILDRAALCQRDSTFAEMYGEPRAALVDGRDLCRAIDEARIDRAVVAGFAFTGARDIETQNEYLVAAAAESRGRLIALATLNPALPAWEKAAESALAAGAAGFGELRPGNQGWSPTSGVGSDVCALAEAHGAVLLWHVSEPVGHAYPGKWGGISPADLAVVAERFPGVKMIAAHLGGGLPFYLQMPEVRHALANVYFDTAAHSLLYDERSIARLVDLAGADRVIFGSDYPLLSARRQLERVRAHLQPDAARAVCGDTAGTLFGDVREQ